MAGGSVAAGGSRLRYENAPRKKPELFLIAWLRKHSTRQPGHGHQSFTVINRIRLYSVDTYDLLHYGLTT